MGTLQTFGWILVGTAGSWFLFDVTFYGNAVFATKIITTLQPVDPNEPAYDQLTKHALSKFIITAIALPGYYLGVFTIDLFGRRQLQMFGFLMTGVVFALLALFAEIMVNAKLGALVVALYGLSFLFANWGPNTTTYVIPSESFPTWARATCHGISAASGKLGAVVGTFGLGEIIETGGSGWTPLVIVLWICTGVSVAGVIWTYIFTRDMSTVSLEDLDAGNIHGPTPSGRIAQGKDGMATGELFAHADVDAAFVSSSSMGRGTETDDEFKNSPMYAEPGSRSGARGGGGGRIQVQGGGAFGGQGQDQSTYM